MHRLADNLKVEIVIYISDVMSRTSTEMSGQSIEAKNNFEAISSLK